MDCYSGSEVKNQNEVEGYATAADATNTNSIFLPLSALQEI